MFVIAIKDPYENDQAAGILGPFKTAEEAQAVELEGLHPDADMVVIKLQTEEEFRRLNPRFFED